MVNNRIKIAAALTLSLLLLNNTAFANQSIAATAPPPAADKNTDVELKIEDSGKLKINVTEPVKKLDTQVFKSKEEMMSQYFQVQKKMDVDDIKVLWESTVERNPVIKFALRKLSTPAEQRRVHSSLMAKSVSALISGVSILPGLLGADSIISSASTTTGSVANKLIASKNSPKELPLTDTELIHLARLVEELQNRIIKTYYEYKSNLEALKLAHTESIKQNIAYTVALRAKNDLSIITTKALYESALKDELKLKQQVKANRLELERLAGADPINNLKLGKIILDGSEVKPEKPESKLSKLNDNIYLNKSVAELATEAGSELQDDRDAMLGDLSILWNAAVERSETIRFAIMKLSNPDGKVDKSASVKKILSPLTGVASIVGLGASDPITATSAMFSGTFLNSLLSMDNEAFNAHLSRVSDADLVLLAQETDNLQQKLVTLYFNYITAVDDLKFADKIVSDRQKSYEKVQKLEPDLKNVANVFYKESLADQYKARQTVLTTRVALEQFVGDEAINSLDKNIQERITMK
jgi:hypothetical protein